jgi:2,4-dienoyl-CoA reductase-like NADH-dependent reductase (Old Yellow Enzyme family)
MKTATSWKEGFQSFESGLQLLRQGLEKGPDALNRLEIEGIIHRFEYCIELAWKIVFNEVVAALAGRYLAAMEQLHRFLAPRSNDNSAYPHIAEIS